MIVFIAFGMPVLFGYILLKASRDYKRESAEPNQEIAKRMANELDVDGTQGFLSSFFFGSNALLPKVSISAEQKCLQSRLRNMLFAT